MTYTPIIISFVSGILIFGNGGQIKVMNLHNYKTIDSCMKAAKIIAKPGEYYFCVEKK